MSFRYSNGIITATIDPLYTPNAPTAASATASGSSGAVVTFTAPANVGGGAITTYAVGSNPSSILTTVSGTVTSVNVTGLTADVTYTFQVWAINAFGPGPYTITNSATPLGNPDRGVFAGGDNGSVVFNVIQYVTIASTGNTTDFGDLTFGRNGLAGFSSSTRGVHSGGFKFTSPATTYNVIDYITIATTGNALDFGDLTVARSGCSGLSSSTRGLTCGGGGNVIDYVTIASLGNAIDFGDLVQTRNTPACFGSSTRGCIGGMNSSGTTSTIDYVTIATTGNAINFGNLLTGAVVQGFSGCNDSTRGLMGAGITTGGARVNVIQYITIASTGNSLDFGDLTVLVRDNAACSNTTRGIFAGGGLSASPFFTNVIEYVTIQTLGNSTDFGDLAAINNGFCGYSSSNPSVQ